MNQINNRFASIEQITGQYLVQKKKTRAGLRARFPLKKY